MKRTLSLQKTSFPCEITDVPASSKVLGLFEFSTLTSINELRTAGPENPFMRFIDTLIHPPTAGRTLLAALLFSAALGAAPAAEPAPASALAAAPAPQKTVLRVTVLGYSRPWRDWDFIVESMSYLQKHWPGLEIKLKSLPHIPLREELRAGGADLVVATSSFFAMDPTEKVRPLATLVSDRASDPNRSSAGVVIVRSDFAERHGIRSIADLRDRSIAAQTEECELGLHYVEHEVAKTGADPAQFFSRVRRDEPGRMMEILKDVRAGRIDAGILRACFLEDLGPERLSELDGSIRVLSPQKTDGLKCLHSTALYPGLILAGTSPLGVEHARRVSALLLSMPVGRDGSSWGITTDFTRTDEMLKTLKLGPYEYLREWTPARLWREHPEAVVAFGLLVLALLGYGAILKRLVRLRTRALEREVEERHRLERAAREAGEELDAMQQAGAVGQISSIIAHELKQPLEAIQNLSRGTMRILDDVEDVPERAVDAVERISAETLHAAEIVDRVRDYGKGGRRPELLPVPAALETAVGQFRTSRRARGVALFSDLHSQGVKGAVRMDPLDLRLVIVNLLTNAVEAASASDDPRVEIRLETAEDGMMRIVVEDNGPWIADETFARLGRAAGRSQKGSGLGLGLMIVRTIIEAARGRLTFERLALQGLRVVVELPHADDGEDAKTHNTTKENA